MSAVDTAARRHAIAVKLEPGDVLEGAPGGQVEVKASITCADGCDLSGGRIEIRNGDQVVAATTLVSRASVQGEREWLAVSLPLEVGVHRWTLVWLPDDDAAGDQLHEAYAQPVSIDVKPHPTSLAVWDVPSPPLGTAFKVKVGLRCSCGCTLAGRTVEIHDESGVSVGRAIVGDTPWPGTDGLHWGNAELPAPTAPGTVTWTAALLIDDADRLHDHTAASFGFRVQPTPTHRLTVRIVAEDQSGVCLDGFEVRVGLAEAWTDIHGEAEVLLPQGQFTLSIRKEGWQADPVNLIVDRSTTIELEARKAPTYAELAQQIEDDIINNYV